MPKVIWTGAIFHDGHPRNGRVVRRGDGELFFEWEWSTDAMGNPIWHQCKEAWREFLISAGNLFVK